MPVPSGSFSGTPSGSPSATPFADGEIIGDVMTAETVTDALGSYQHVTLSPQSDLANSVDPAAVDQTITGSDWDDAEILDGQRYISTFIASQTLDSIALDRDEDGWQQWIKDDAPTYLGDPVPGQLLDISGNLDRALLIFNDPNNATPELVRDGGARMDDATIEIDSIASDAHEGGEFLVFTGTASAAYRLSDASAIANLVAQGFGTEDEVRTNYPELADDVDGHYFTDLDFSYSIEQVDGGWLIRDFSLDWSANIEGANQA